MAVYDYNAVYRENESRQAEGTLVARNKLHAMDLLTQRGLVKPRLKQVTGFTAFLKQLTADIR